MKAKKNIKAELRKAIVENLAECKQTNTDPNDDQLWVMCKKTFAYTNEACVILTTSMGDYIECKDMAECADKYTDICLKAGATASDIYLGY